MTTGRMVALSKTAPVHQHTLNTCMYTPLRYLQRR